MVKIPMPMQSEPNHELASVAVAPNWVAAWKTTTAELVIPTRTTIRPATKAEIEKSFLN